MPAPPLTHHDIIRIVAPLTKRGINVNLSACDRAARYIEFQSQNSDVPDSRLTYSVQAGRGNVMFITRIVAHSCGLVSTLSAVVSDIEAALAAFDTIPTSRQLDIGDNYVLALSYTLESVKNAASDTSQLQLRFACARVSGLDIRIDTSTGAEMPADVRIMMVRKPSSFLRETLADGRDSPLLHRSGYELVRLAGNKHSPSQQDGSSKESVARSDSEPSAKPDPARFQQTVNKLPEDLLAVLGPQWRPLVNQGDHWKGVLRKLGKGVQRTVRAEKFIHSALHHLSTTLSQPPAKFHDHFKQERWQVFVRRLKPVMVFVGILAMMPISWLLVSEGGVRMHPLALGLTPLLMVGVIALTTREIPIMEIPSRPAPLGADFWLPPN